MMWTVKASGMKRMETKEIEGFTAEDTKRRDDMMATKGKLL